MLEIGSSSGYVSQQLKINHPELKLLFSTDISPNACISTKETLELEYLEHNVICGDLFSCFKDAKMFDIVIFNPPYIPSEESEIHLPGHLTWHGGKSGLDTIDMFLTQALKYLSLNTTVIYLVCFQTAPLSKLASYQQLIWSMDDQVVLKRKCINEFLAVHRFCPPNQMNF